MIARKHTWNWTNEQVVDHYIAHMKEQGCQAKNGGGACMYLVDVVGDDGIPKTLACGVGCLLPWPLLKSVRTRIAAVVRLMHLNTSVAESLLGPQYEIWRRCSPSDPSLPVGLHQRVVVLQRIQRHHDGPEFKKDFESFKKSLFDPNGDFRLDPNLRPEANEDELKALP